LKKRIAIFGSTGSIGTQSLEVISNQNDFFEVELLTAFNQHELLIEQAIRYKPNVVVIGNENHYNTVDEALGKYGIKVYAGSDALSQVMEMDSINIVVMAIVGFAALKPTLAAVENKKVVALANKESLVVAGNIIAETAIRNNSKIIPVDSELSAIFQCLVGEFDNPVKKIVLTASGGPFRGYNEKMLQNVSIKQALNHPTWKMGNKVTIDSATLMNKGFEAIEAKWLFNLRVNQIEIVIHPESIIHSLVYFTDGSVKAQLSLPDMRIPIQYALSYPGRLAKNSEMLDLVRVNTLHFEKPDVKKFRNLALAFEALKKGGNLSCILNASNELAVQAFLTKKIDFVQIPNLVEKCLESVDFIKNPDLNDYFETDRLTRIKATELIQTL
jgi:1-deoxy-D-xylulose-5-phosphate reductoisomerase